MENTIIFIGSPERSSKEHTTMQTMKNLFCVSPYDIMLRILASFVPPVGKKFQKIYVDLVGPSLALVILSAILHYGHAYKEHSISISPTEFLTIYAIVMPIITKTLLKLSKSTINFSEVVSMIGYAMYGYILTLCTSILFFSESNNTFFFFCLIVIGGLSTFRLSIVFLKTIPIPGARLLVCSSVSIIQILALVFIHFAYMHKTYTYKREHYGTLKH